MNVKNWSFFYSKDGKQKLKQNIIDTVSLWSAVGLLWYSFVSMIEEYFPEFLQGLDWWAILPWLFVLWLGYEWPKRYLKRLVLPCRLVGIAIPVIYMLVNFEKIIDGFLQLAQIYLPYVNSYYKTAFYLEPTNEGAYFGIAVTSLCMLLWWIVWMLAYGFKKRIFLGIFPIFALVMELVVGLSPRGNGLLYLLFGTVILAIMGGTTIVKKVVVLACVGLSVLLAGIFFEGDIQKLASKEQKQAVLEWQKNLSLEDFSLANLLQLDFHFNWEQLNNNSPQYTGKVVLEIEADTVPQGAIYLKGFYGTTYENGNWEYDDSYFKEACKKAGISEQEAAQFLFDLQYTYFKENARMVRYEIKSKGTTGNVAYAPYFSNYTTFDEPYDFMGDFLLKKDYFDDYIKIKSMAKMPDLYSISTQSDYYWYVLYGEEKYKEIQETLEWYDSLADAYLEVPEDMDFISEATSAAVDETDYMPSYSGLEYSEKNKAYHVAIDIKNYLYAQMSYSLILDDLPIGADPIEYALFTGHEGYCMHFASAATLMFREAGVPARYVSGYVVNPSEFEEVDGGYKAEVQDYNAHAWVEIYMEGVGWIPFEVTPGYSSYGEKHPTEEDPEKLEEIAEQWREHLESEENSESEKPEDSETQNNTESDTENNTEESASTQDFTNTEDSTSNPGIGNGNGSSAGFDWNKFIEAAWNVFKVLGMVGLLVGIIVAIIFGVRYWIRRFEAVLDQEIKKNLTRKAVKRMNKRIYRMLRVRNIGNLARVPITGKLSDAAYEKALIVTFTEVLEEDWTRYMEIAKKSQYSLEEISTEEMMHCYECYKKANIFNKLLTSKWFNKK